MRREEESKRGKRDHAHTHNAVVLLDMEPAEAVTDYAEVEAALRDFECGLRRLSLLL